MKISYAMMVLLTISLHLSAADMIELRYDLIRLYNYSTSDMKVGPLTNTVFKDYQGKSLRSVVCVGDTAVCNHVEGYFTIKSLQKAYFGYQSFTTSITEPAGTKANSDPLYQIISKDSLDTSKPPRYAEQMSVYHKGRKTDLVFRFGNDWIFTEYGGYSALATTMNWRMNWPAMLGVYDDKVSIPTLAPTATAP